jgi:flagellar biogenesis protein FliO
MRAFSGGGGNAQLEMLAQLPLGTRERAVLVRVGDSQVLIGVAPGNVRTLHVLRSSQSPAANVHAHAHASASASAVPDAVPDVAPDVVRREAAPLNAAVARPSFRALLLRSLGK